MGTGPVLEVWREQANFVSTAGIGIRKGKWLDPVLTRLWKTTMQKLWGDDVELVRVRDLLGMKLSCALTGFFGTYPSIKSKVGLMCIC